jgi:hypothetical protein
LVLNQRIKSLFQLLFEGWFIQTLTSFCTFIRPSAYTSLIWARIALPSLQLYSFLIAFSSLGMLICSAIPTTSKNIIGFSTVYSQLPYRIAIASHYLTVHSMDLRFLLCDTAHILGSCCGVGNPFLGKDNSEQTYH